MIGNARSFPAVGLGSVAVFLRQQAALAFRNFFLPLRGIAEALNGWKAEKPTADLPNSKIGFADDASLREALALALYSPTAVAGADFMKAYGMVTRTVDAETQAFSNELIQSFLRQSALASLPSVGLKGCVVLGADSLSGIGALGSDSKQGKPVSWHDVRTSIASSTQEAPRKVKRISRVHAGRSE